MAIDGEAILTQALDMVHTARALDRLGGIRVLHDELISPEASHDLDPFHILMDLSDLGISGYQAADWLREHHRIDGGISDHRRIELTLSQADNDATVDRAVAAFENLIANASSLPRPKPVQVPDPSSLELEVGELPRDAFFARSRMSASRRPSVASPPKRSRPTLPVSRSCCQERSSTRRSSTTSAAVSPRAW